MQFVLLCAVTLCACNLMRILIAPDMDSMLSFSCTFSNLIFLFLAWGRRKTCQALEPTYDSMLQKQIQILNWRIMFNKALTLHSFKKGMRSKETTPLIRRNSGDIPDFHAMECRNRS